MRQLTGLRLALALFGAAVFFGWTGSALATVFTVTSSANSATGRCARRSSTPTGAREPTRSTSHLPPPIRSAGPYAISLTDRRSPLITSPVTIDGRRNPAGSGLRIVELVGSRSRAGDARGLFLYPGSDGSTIRGLVIAGFPLDGDPHQSSNNRIANNYLGMDPTGRCRGNNDGVAIETGAGIVIGGRAPATGTSSPGIAATPSMSHRHGRGTTTT